MTRMIKRSLAALAALSLVAACGNDPDSKSSRDLAKNLTGLLKPKPKAPATTQGLPAEALQQVLAATPNSVMLFTVENAKTQVPMIQIERNGAYRTYGTAARQSITVKNGFLTASRGLGGDLMSADLDPSLSLISSRSAGQTQRVMRYLSGEDVTVPYNFTCTVSLAAKQDQLQGMRETCVAGDTKIENTYAVDPSGRILASRQWLGPIGGYGTFALLRD